MRLMVMAASCFSVLFLAMSGPCAYGEPVAKDGVSFSLPFEAAQNGDSGPRTRLALANKFKPGLNVVLIGKKICKARTGTTFTHSLGAPDSDHKFQATYLLGHGKCDPKGVNVAVMGVEAEAIGVISPQEARSAVPKDIELKARRHLLARDAASAKLYSYAPLSHDSPKTFRVKDGMLLHFNWKDEDNGPSVWVVKDRVFLLPGVCRAAHRFLFFSIEDRLHLAYGAGGCCRCGDYTFYVYDLSGSKPKKLYENGELAD